MPLLILLRGCWTITCIACPMASASHRAGGMDLSKFISRGVHSEACRVSEKLSLIATLFFPLCMLMKHCVVVWSLSYEDMARDWISNLQDNILPRINNLESRLQRLISDRQRSSCSRNYWTAEPRLSERIYLLLHRFILMARLFRMVILA